MRDKMNDLEITKRCAKLVGAKHFKFGDCIYPDTEIYNPLDNAKQAFRLLELLEMQVTSPLVYPDEKVWAVESSGGDGADVDLKRAICICAARDQKYMAKDGIKKWLKTLQK